MGITEKPWFRKALVTIAGRPKLRDFIRISYDCKGVQDRLLRKIVAESKDTAFGREHGFVSIRTVREFRDAIPVGGYEKHQPYIERMCKGEADVLFPGKAIFYNTTSGTTSKPKLIPVSREYFTHAYSGLSKLWLYTCMMDNPRMYDGKSLSAVSPAVEGHVEDGTPYGSISGMVYRNIPAVLKSTHSAPYPVVCIKDYLKKYYAIVRCALPHSITCIIAASPSSVIRFHQTIIEEYADLVKDIHDGTLRADVAAQIPPAERDGVLRLFSPDAPRAREMERLMRVHGEALRPKHFWPHLALVNTWRQGNFAQFIPKLDGFFPDSAVIRAFGYQASEGRAGIVLGNDWTHSVIAAHIYHFEFIEAALRFTDNPPVLEAHEVEVGKRYYILFSNGSGLYRYDINDIVEIIGFYNQLPLFRFIQKGEGVTSLTGEKLSEEQVIQATREIAGEMRIRIPFYLMFCDERDFCYTFFAELPRGMTGDEKTTFIAALDDRLRKLNMEYEIKRGSRRLAAPLLQETKENSYELYKESLLKADLAREGQYKDVYLTKNEALLCHLKRLLKTGEAC
jgi:hypothetical protein